MGCTTTKDRRNSTVTTQFSNLYDVPPQASVTNTPPSPQPALESGPTHSTLQSSAVVAADQLQPAESAAAYSLRSEASIGQLQVYADVLLEGGMLQSQRLDASQSHAATSPPCIGHAVGLSGPEVVQLRKDFMSIDVDDIGVIGKCEFVQFYGDKEGCCLTAEEVAEVVDSLDADGTGTLNFDEFIRAFRGVLLREESKTHPESAQKYIDYISSARTIISMRRRLSQSGPHSEASPAPARQLRRRETVPFTDGKR